MSRTMPHASLLVEASFEGVNRRIWLKGILVEQDGEVRVAGVRKN